MRKNIKKEKLIEQLKKTPVVQIACEKTEIGRATYYRWRKESAEFAEKADEAIKEGLLLVNDLAESQLISAIRDKNLGAIVFWLKHHHRAYTTKVEINASINKLNEQLTPEQEAVVREALRLTALSAPEVGAPQNNGNTT